MLDRCSVLARGGGGLDCIRTGLDCIRCERQDTHRQEQVLSLYLVFVRRSREGSLYYPLVFELSEREGALQCILEPLEAGLQTSRLQTLDEVGRLD